MARPRRRDRRELPAGGAAKPTEWIIVFLEERDGSVPAKSFLDDCPTAARAQLLATISAVRAAPPPSFPTSALWHVMRDEMKGFHEARDKHEKRLYRSSASSIATHQIMGSKALRSSSYPVASRRSAKPWTTGSTERRGGGATNTWRPRPGASCKWGSTTH
jgi:hypothetical protein